MGYDESCFDLAEMFMDEAVRTGEVKLSDADVQKHKKKLAQTIQDSIDSYMQFEFANPLEKVSDL